MTDDRQAKVCWMGNFEGIQFRLVAVKDEDGKCYPAMERKEADMIGDPRWVQVERMPLGALVFFSAFISNDAPPWWSKDNVSF
jgi:hypothetical protein